MGRTLTVLQSPLQSHQRRGSGPLGPYCFSALWTDVSSGRAEWSRINYSRGTTLTREETGLPLSWIQWYSSWDTARSKTEHFQLCDTTNSGTKQFLGPVVRDCTLCTQTLLSPSVWYCCPSYVFVRSLSNSYQYFTNSFTYYFHVKSK